MVAAGPLGTNLCRETYYFSYKVALNAMRADSAERQEVGHFLKCLRGA